VLLFTISKDVNFKVKRKGEGSITENIPTFSKVTQAKSELKRLKKNYFLPGKQILIFNNPW